MRRHGLRLGNPLTLRLNLFTRLSQSERERLDQLTRRNVRTVEPRRDVIREGDRPRAVNLVLDGWACRYKQLPDGRRQVVSFFIPGDFCDSNVFILKEMDHSIGAITRLKVAEIAPDDFQDLMDGSQRITQALWWHELVDAAIAREWTTNIGQRTAYERISHLLCELFIRLRGVGLTSENSADFPLTQTDLADATGLTAVHVNRTLQELRRDGLIELQGRVLTIPDLARLQDVAMFNSNYLHLEHEGRHLDAND
jgi:CRP-like cAMP-binding protein